MPRDARATPRRSAPTGVVVPTQPSTDNRGGPLSWRAREVGESGASRGRARETRDEAFGAARDSPPRASDANAILPGRRPARWASPRIPFSLHPPSMPKKWRDATKPEIGRPSSDDAPARRALRSDAAWVVPGVSDAAGSASSVAREWRDPRSSPPFERNPSARQQPCASVCRMRERFDSGRTGIDQSAAAVRGSAAHTLDSDNPPSLFADRPRSRAPPLSSPRRGHRVRRRAT